MRPLRFVLLATALAALLLAGTPLRAQAPTVLHVATGGKESDAQVYYAQDLGYFARAGLNVEITSTRRK